jgi:hypothetical protein
MRLITACCAHRSYWILGASQTSHAMSAPNNALPRLRPLGTHAKKPRESGRCSCAMPQMWAQPTPHERPAACHGMHMDCPHAVTIVIAGVRAPAVVDALMVVSPRTPASIHAVRSRVHPCPWLQRVLAERLDRLWLHLGQQRDHHVTAALSPAKDGRFFLRQCATASWAVASASTTFAILARDACGGPFMAGHYRGFIALHLGGKRHRGLFLTIPARRWAVLGCTSRPVRAHSWPIGSFDTLQTPP